MWYSSCRPGLWKDLLIVKWPLFRKLLVVRCRISGLILAASQSRKPLPDLHMRGSVFLAVYIFGFTYTGEESAHVSPYAICHETLPDTSMKTSFVIDHLETKHGAWKQKPLEYFQRKLTDWSVSKFQIVSGFWGVLLFEELPELKNTVQLKSEP